MLLFRLSLVIFKPQETNLHWVRKTTATPADVNAPKAFVLSYVYFEGFKTSEDSILHKSLDNHVVFFFLWKKTQNSQQH